jgi:hypothetical protein
MQINVKFYKEQLPNLREIEINKLEKELHLDQPFKKLVHSNLI